MCKKLMMILLLCLTVTAYGQVSVKVDNLPLKDAISVIEQNSGYSFFFSDAIEGLDSPVSISVENEKIETVMDRLFAGLDISYTINGKQVVLSHKKSVAVQEDRYVRGVVTDKTGLPVIGTAVMIEGQKGGAVTDIDGKYEIKVTSPQAVLIFSNLGYKEVSEVVGGRSEINVVMSEDMEQLEEVVVVGYGTQKKVNLTGSVAMVDSEELSARPIANMTSGLQGLLPGVTIVNPSGQPGVSNATIRVRGVGTLGNSNPLVLIDGVEGDLSAINPDDIESISVLKDAASSSIYGARAANGVLLVTTKKVDGQKAKSKLTFSAYAGIQTPARLPELCSAEEYMLLENEAKTNVGSPISWYDSDIEKVRTGSDPNNYASTDWVREVVKKVAPQQNYAISQSGSIGNTGYMVNYRYFDQQGLTVGIPNGEKRHNVRFKLNTRLLDRISIQSNIGYVNSKVTSPVNSLSNGGGALYAAMRIAPYAPVKYTDGTWACGGGSNSNPVAHLYDGGRQRNSTEQFSIMETLKVDILKGWDATLTYNMTSTNGFKDVLKKTIRYTHPETGDVKVNNDPNSLSNTDRKGVQQTFILQTNFDVTFAGSHNLSGVIGMSQEWYKYNSFTASREKLVTEDNPALNLGDPSLMSNDASTRSWAIRSGFGRLNYNYAERYLVEVNLRYDLSSRFHKSRRGGWFPSVSLGWRLSEEPFMKNTKDVISNFKFRTSWGMLGNQYVGSSDFPYMSILESSSKGMSLIGGNATSGYMQSVLANPNLTWEKIKMFDIGLDLSLLDSRFNFTFDWYSKLTEDILLQLNYPDQLGAKPAEENAGKVRNRGWEMDLSWRDTHGDFFYSLGFNLSDVKNTIVSMGDMAPDLSGNQIRRVGDPIDAFYGYIADGLMMPEDFKSYNESTNTYIKPIVPVVLGNKYQPGDIKYKDISGPDGVPDGRITPEYDRVVIGSKIPRYTYSFRGNFAWKGIDFSFVFQGVGKCDGYLTGSARHAFQDMAGYPHKVHLDRFNMKSNPNPAAAYPRLTYNVSYNQDTFSTYWLEDASYFRLKNIQLGYTFPNKLTKKARISNLRLYVSADNVFTASKFFYAYDPEIPVSKGGYYPQVSTVIFGINLSFE